MPKAQQLTEQLIAIDSITPDDNGCQQIIAERLSQVGFNIEHLPFGSVSNLWACYGQGSPCIVFAGHTDVVPPGPLEQWTSNPFLPEVREGHLFGRGAADMKSGLSAMVVAAENFVQQTPEFTGSIGFLITSDEEGVAIDGTDKVVQHLMTQGQKIDYCIVGEASSDSRLADVIKIGRRGSLTGKLIIHGQQGHVAYPNKANNAIHIALPALKQLTEEVWDHGNEDFPATSFQISNIHSGTGAKNVIPGEIVVDFNWRFSPELTDSILKERLTKLLEPHGFEFSIEWQRTSQPFYTQGSALIEVVCSAVEETLGYRPECLTNGGTSDGRFIAPTGAEVVELGPINHSIHQVDEHINVRDLEVLTQLYQRVLEKLF